MQVRHATADDRPALQHLYDEHLMFVRSADRRIRRLPEIVWNGRQGGEVWVGEVQQRVVGYVSTWLRNDEQWGRTVWIDHMAVDAHHPYPGLGRRLIEAVRAAAVQFECGVLAADVPQRNPIEQAFWLALGAQRVNHRGAPGCDVMRLIP
ncbi:MAG: GNAT family N-acetyltransferase [Chloroflexi bacterium]|nr:GNAT family N-acetyltransferase [Chloroflexota bacterium]